MNKLLFHVFLLVTFSAYGQQITLRQCLDSAIARYAISHQSEVYNQILETEYQISSSINLPQLKLTGQATWQSQALELPIKLPGVEIPALNQDQYKISLEISQSIYNGGVVKAKKELSQQDNAINNTQNQIEINKLKQILIFNYYQILLVENNLDVLKTQKTILLQKLDDLANLKKQGMASQDAKNLLESEITTLDINQIGLETQLKTLKDKLNFYTGLNPATLELPDETLSFSETQNRPEFQLMSYNQQKLSTAKSLNNAAQRPNVFAFSTLGYGRPGLNYLSNDFSAFAIIGVGMQWQLWNWNRTLRQNQILDLQTSLIENQKMTFTTNLDAELLTLKGEIASQSAILDKTEQLIKLRKKVLESADARQKIGEITTSDYVKDVQNFQKALLDQKNAQLKLSLAKSNYLFALGKL
ncbi:MAG: TolC family protein [Bacteroidales bacterium]|nr:TolC family protein [Bacteroidales bacterium]